MTANTPVATEELPAELLDFLRDALGDGWSVQPLHGDASVRRYFRVQTPTRPLILAYYPEAVRESLERFLAAHRAVASAARVPALVQHSVSAILQDDVGDRTLFDLLHEDAARALPAYRSAIDLLVDFQGAGSDGVAINPAFDAKKFNDELLMTAEYFVERLLGASVTPRLLDLFGQLAAALTEHPYVLCHRDYHGQNIHIVNDTLYVIDFQDLRMGPDTYDLASLLRDRGAGVVLGRGVEDELLQYYAERGGFAPGLRHRYFVNLLQRSVKAIGTFARQAVTRDRTHYLEFIPPTLAAVEDALREAPEFEEMRALFPMKFDSKASGQ